MAILDFSVSGWHGFGSVTQVCFGISVSNFMCMSFVSVGRSLKIASYVAFKMAALWFWTMFNCNPPIAHCHPLLWGGGILVDHWSTISSCYWQSRILTTIAHAQTNRRALRVSALALLFVFCLCTGLFHRNPWDYFTGTAVTNTRGQHRMVWVNVGT